MKHVTHVDALNVQSLLQATSSEALVKPHDVEVPETSEDLPQQQHSPVSPCAEKDISKSVPSSIEPPVPPTRPNALTSLPVAPPRNKSQKVRNPKEPRPSSPNFETEESSSTNSLGRQPPNLPPRPDRPCEDLPVVETLTQSPGSKPALPPRVAFVEDDERPVPPPRKGRR